MSEWRKRMAPSLYEVADGVDPFRAFTVRVTPHGAAAISKVADAAGMPREEFVRVLMQRAVYEATGEHVQMRPWRRSQTKKRRAVSRKARR